MEEGNPCELLLRMQISTTVIGTQDGRSLKKVKSNYLYLTISILSLYPQETIPVSQIDIYTSIFIHYSIIHNSRDMEKTSVSINRWMIKKMWYVRMFVCMYLSTMQYYSAIEKKEIHWWKCEWTLRMLC